MKKKSVIKISLLFLFLAFILFAALYLYPSLRIASGYAAKYTCSYTFISGLPYEKIRHSFNFFPVNKVECTIDTNAKSVTASLFGIAERKAFFYQRGNVCGCILDSVDNINQRLRDFIPEVTQDKKTGYPAELPAIPDSFLQQIEIYKLNDLLRTTIDSNPATLAVSIAYKNYMVSEIYADGINSGTRLLGWSMTKTVLNALYGILEKNKTISLKEKSCFKEWENDARREITLNNLMQMSSGLNWVEDYSIKADVTQMLYLEPDVSLFALQKSLEKKPGEIWHYSSGTTNILSRYLKSKFAGYNQYLSFPFDSLFHIIGMNSAVVEMDNTGNYIFSSYGWATARDWTKFGLLYLNKGNWNGTQVFSPQWAEYSVAPVNSSAKKYGAQIWLNAAGRLPAVPNDAFLAIGYGGQNILVIPSEELVIVILSARQNNFDFNSFYSKILDCF